MRVMIPRAAGLLILIASLLGCVPLEPQAESWGMPEARRRRAENAKFATLVDAYFSWHYAVHPVRATRDGIHDRDGRFADLSARGVQAVLDSLITWRARLDGIDRTLLSDDAYYDALILESFFRREILDLVELRRWERHPTFYLDLLKKGLSLLVDLPFAPIEVRLAALKSRLASVPGVLASARENLKDPSAPAVQFGIDHCAELAAILSQGLDEAMRRAEGKAPAGFAEARSAATAALEEFTSWLKERAAAGAGDSAALGKELLSRLLEAEGLSSNIDALIQGLERRFEELQKELLDVIASSDAAAFPQVAPEKLLEERRSVLERVRQICVGSLVSDLLNWNIEFLPLIPPSKSYRHVAPGPFERAVSGAFLSPTRERDSVDLELETVHAVFPGSFTANFARRLAGTKIRQMLPSSTFVRGWAQYIEGAYFESQGATQPGLRSRFAPRALDEVLNALVFLKVHGGRMTVEEAAEFLDHHGVHVQDARLRAMSVIQDFRSAAHALGALALKSLRDEVRQAQGDAFNEREFHTRLLLLGCPPIDIARQIFLKIRPKPTAPEVDGERDAK